jgi:uncharacterized membrane protein
MLEHITAFFRSYPLLCLPLFLLALYCLFQFVKKLVIRILALAVILLALLVGYTVFVRPKTGLSEIKNMKEKAEKTVDKVKATAKTAQEIKETVDKIRGDAE